VWACVWTRPIRENIERREQVDKVIGTEENQLGEMADEETHDGVEKKKMSTKTPQEEADQPY